MSETVEPLGLKAGKAKERKGRISRGLPPGDPRHGRYTTYVNWGCRCEPCKAANTAAGKAFREGRSKTVGEEPRPMPEPVNEPMPEPESLTYEPF